jgi:hypothetical protein
VGEHSVNAYVYREQTRKTEVENRREELKQKAAGEKEEAERINEEIQAQWKQILSKQIPQELYEVSPVIVMLIECIVGYSRDSEYLQ